MTNIVSPTESTCFRFPSQDNVVVDQVLDGQTFRVVTTPKVAQAAREHYNCPMLNGPVLENEGGSLTQGTHWESHLLYPEIMNGILYNNLATRTVVSRITLSLFEDSGWYTVNYPIGMAYSTDKLIWGSDQGCDFITGNCNDTAAFPYACSPTGQSQCAYDYQSSGVCQQLTFFDQCAIAPPTQFCQSSPSDPQEICVDNSVTGTSCAEYQCVQLTGTELQAYQVSVNGLFVWCYPGQTVNSDQWQCPPTKYACSRGVVTMLALTEFVPPPLCDATCQNCTIAQNPAFCDACAAGMMLNGNRPTTCIPQGSECVGSTYPNPSGTGCSECPAGCKLCTGPQHSDCAACVDANLYRETSSRTGGDVCIGMASCSANTATIDAFGVRTCVSMHSLHTGQGGGAGVVGTNPIRVGGYLLMAYLALSLMHGYLSL